MTLTEWLSTKGRAVALAKHLGVSKSMVSQMAGGSTKQVRVPPKHYRAIRDFTGGEVTLEDLVPAHSVNRSSKKTELAGE